MDLNTKLKKLKHLGYCFVYSNTGSLIGANKYFIPIVNKNINMLELEKICDDVLKHDTNPVFDLLEKYKLINYI